MRIICLFSILLLGACSTGQPTASAPSTGNLRNAAAYCLTKGYDRATYDYDVCYRNRPEVQANARSGRMTNLAIITQNRSPHTHAGRSYPVE